MTNSIVRGAILQILQALPGAGHELRRRAILVDMRRAICYNQSTLANFIFVSGRKHKDLKESLARYRNASPPNKHRECERLKENFKELQNYVDRKFTAISVANFEFLQDFLGYKSYAGKKPCVCVKGIRDNKIYNLASDSRSYFYPNSDGFEATENTAFSQVEKTGGKEYFCNDIPKKFKKREYSNNRIKTIAFDYRKPGFLKNLLYKFTDEEDTQWQLCWRHHDPTIDCPPPIRDCYKSTLVIPLALKRHSDWLSDEFKSQFGITNETNVFGFLCIDHQNKNFFNEKEDVHLGYIFADILGSIPGWTYAEIRRQGLLSR